MVDNSKDDDPIYDSILKLIKMPPVYSTTLNKDTEYDITPADLVNIWKYHRSISETYKNKYGYKYKTVHWLEDTMNEYDPTKDTLEDTEFKCDYKYIDYYNQHPFLRDLFEAHLKTENDHLIVYILNDMILMQHHSDKIWKSMYKKNK